MSSSNLCRCSQSASQNAPRLRHSISSLFRQSSLSQRANSSSRYSNSASHSCRKRARKRRGTITPLKRINQRQKRKRVVCVELITGFIKHSSKIESFASQRDDRINPCCAARRQIGGQQRHGKQQQRRKPQRGGIGRRQAIKQRRGQARHGHDQRQPRRHASQ